MLISLMISLILNSGQSLQNISKDMAGLQYSVRELKNSDRILNNILLYIEHKFWKSLENTDSIIIFSLCEWCKKKVIRYWYSVQEEQEILFI